MLYYGQDKKKKKIGLSTEPWEDQLVDDNLTSNTGTSDMKFSYWSGYENNGQKTNTAEVQRCTY